SPRMLTSKCTSTGSLIQLSSGMTGSFWPQTRHALRATPHGEKPESVEEERRTCKVAEDRQKYDISPNRCDV
ncbi:hypothetical protein EDD22DRAFT_895786, partial [Suillus occidentalis]